MQAAARSRNSEIPRSRNIRLAAHVRAIQRLNTTDGTNEPFPTDTDKLKDVVRGGASVLRGGRGSREESLTEANKPHTAALDIYVVRTRFREPRI